MKGPQGFGELMNIIMNVVMCLVISLFAGFLNNFVSGGWEAVFQFYIMHLPVNILVAIPVER